MYIYISTHVDKCGTLPMTKPQMLMVRQPFGSSFQKPPDEGVQQGRSTCPAIIVRIPPWWKDDP